MISLIPRSPQLLMGCIGIKQSAAVPSSAGRRRQAERHNHDESRKHLANPPETHKLKGMTHVVAQLTLFRLEFATMPVDLHQPGVRHRTGLCLFLGFIRLHLRSEGAPKARL